MSLSAIALCSRALIRLGAAPIDSFDDGTAEAEVAANLYPPIRANALAAHPWSFIKDGVADESALPPFFDQMLIATLAAEFCVPLTESHTRAEFLRRLAEDEFRRAKLIDSRNVTIVRVIESDQIRLI